VLGSIAASALVLGSLVLAAAPASAANAKPTVTVVKANGIGKILADAKGMALYTLTANGAAVPCTDACLSAWPALVTKGKPKGAEGVKKLGVTATGQVTQAGLPLYLFAADKTKGQAAGEGISSFGGVWHVVKANGSSSASSSSSSSSSSSGSSGSGSVGGLGY
jgi:predicted lipoprotein with Yx(FWY)xxD motif